jgi:hypothetical protein
MARWCHVTNEGKIEVLGGKPVPLSLCPRNSPSGLAGNRICLILLSLLYVKDNEYHLDADEARLILLMSATRFNVACMTLDLMLSYMWSFASFAN